MAKGNTFDTKEPELSSVLDDIHHGIIQLPDFQRGWVWDDDHIRSLIASVTLSHPIGAIMLLEVGGDTAKFQPRPVQGADVAGVQPEQLILDGQQRLTSLYLSLRSGKPVPTRTSKDEEIERVYYLDMAKCVDDTNDRVDAILSLPPTRKLTSDFGRKVELDVSNREKEFEAGLVPAVLLLDQAGFSDWRTAYQEHFGLSAEKSKLLLEFEKRVWYGVQKYKVPVIELLKSTSKDAVCQVFEKVNTGGVPLTVFELMTATFAADGFRLRPDWEAREKRIKNDKKKTLDDLNSTDFLTTVTLLATWRRRQTPPFPPVSAKRRDVLRLSLEQYKQEADIAEHGFELAWRFLAKQRIYESRDLPYAAQLIPLAAICGLLGKRSEEEPVTDRLARWYWCGVFGELYGGANEGRYANDVQDVLAWLDGTAAEPRTIQDANFTPTRLLSLQTRLSAAYKGIMARLLVAGSKDLLTGNAIEFTNYVEEAVDIHHLFPRRYCEAKTLDRSQWNSVVNKAPLTARTNRSIGGDAPSVYLERLDRKMDTKRVDEILSTHLADAQFMRNDSFSEFLRDRASRVLDAVEEAMGKAVVGRDSEEVKKAFGGPLHERRA
jgi:hypothetical protein